MDRMMTRFRQMDDSLFYRINGSRQLFRSFFGYVTHLGGARATVSAMLCLFIFSQYFTSIQKTVVVAMISLTFSHILMAMIKRMVRRIRPYIKLPDAILHGYEFKDHSFPSGHSTAIFSVTIPFMVHFPASMLILFIMSSLVGYSRVVLGVHYPSDVVAGAFLACVTTLSVMWFML
ncbi:phosphatase PAP2 family protein [Bacillus sp. KH172YL63]|uniref:phosphatase PAP2 family protein n=1 Tax=Bacillus sp. KH172YL63 TaxID=2709784 RepID=UPI0013E421B6|nr:phosphatase PAP2 family protein [Bacillus sp. KH172YL63]BCB04570.1 phosphatidylglycerophosphatase B [Bacillus sp. KH172YL63]